MEAISARVTGASGQNTAGSAPHPDAIPAAARALMLEACLCPGTSVNPAGSGPGSRSKALVRKTAARALVTVSSGQNRSGRAAHPLDIPSAVSRLTWPDHHSAFATSVNPAAPAAGLESSLTPESVRAGSPPSSARTSHTAITQRRIGTVGHSRPGPHSVPWSTPRDSSTFIAGVCTPEPAVSVSTE